MFRNTRVATILLGIIATFFTFQLLVGGMGFVALRQTNQDVGQLYRLSSEQVNAVNSAALSLVAARTDPTTPPAWPRATRATPPHCGWRVSASPPATAISRDSPAA